MASPSGGDDASAAGRGANAGMSAPKPAFTTPTSENFLTNISFFRDLLTDHTKCGNRFLFAASATTPLYPLVVGMAFVDVKRENAAAGLRRVYVLRQTPSAQQRPAQPCVVCPICRPRQQAAHLTQ